MQNLEIVIKFLSYLGLDFEESKIYLTLLNKGASTILEISRATKISRTNVYRIIDRLKEGGFVEESNSDPENNQNKKLIHPAGMHKLEMLVKEQENKSEFLRNIFPEISTIIPASDSISQPNTKILFYKGIDGIKQIYWNIFNAKYECLGYILSNVEENIGAENSDSWIREFKSKRLKFRELIGVGRASDLTEESRGFESRFISKDILEITQQYFIYNDVIAYFNKVDNEFFGVEIYNQASAKLQKQLFESAWRLGVKI